MLRYSEPVYRRLLDFPGAPNRLLASDYVKAAHDAGFELAVVIPAEVADASYIDGVRDGLANHFRARSDQDLGALDFAFVARAPRASGRGS